MTATRRTCVEVDLPPASLQYNVHLIGDLELEEWASYLDETQWLVVLIGLLQERMIDAQAFVTPPEPRDLPTQLLLKRRRGRRTVMVHRDDPRGIIYVLRHNRGDYDMEAEIQYAITLRELLREPEIVFQARAKEPAS